MTFEEARAQFPVLERVAYLQAGSAGPLARATTEAMRAEEERNLADGRVGLEYIEHVLALRAELRAELAGLVGVDAEQVALTGSTTDGCNLVVAGLDLDPGDEVVTTTDEHFGLIGPLHASGARVVVVAPDSQAILAAVTPRTRLLAVSHVLWTTGQILPVHALRERTRVPVLVDAAQSVGTIPVDANGIDFLTISGQKWLCGPESTGALVVAEPDRLRVARPSYFSQERYDEDGAFEPGRSTALRSQLDPFGAHVRAARRRAVAAGMALRAGSCDGGALPGRARCCGFGRRRARRTRDHRVVAS